MKQPLPSSKMPLRSLTRPHSPQGAAGRAVPRAGAEAPEPALTDSVTPEAESGCLCVERAG